MRRGVVVLTCLCACGKDATPDPDAAVTPDASARLALSPPAFDFGDVDLDIQFPVLTGFTLSNTGDVTIELPTTAFTISGVDAADYGTSASGCDTTLEPGKSCGVVVTFLPHARAMRVATLDVLGLASAGLSGAGVTNRNLIVVPSARDFGDVPAGTAGAPFTFTVIDELVEAPATLSPLPEGFTLVGTTCTDVIPLHGTCTIDVALAPATGGAFTGDLAIALGNETARAGVAGRSTTPLAVAPFTQLLDQVLIGNAGSTATLTVTNTSEAATGTLTTEVLGSDFLIDSTTCTSIAPTESCDVTVKFDPATRGAKLAQLEVGDPTSGLTSRANLRADAYAILIIGPATFPNTTVNQTSAKQNYKVINASGSQTGAITASLAGSSDFAIATNGCAAGLAANTSCSIELTLRPSSTGARLATLSVSAGPGGSDDFAVSGNGI